MEGEEWKEDLPDFDLITSDNISKNPKISVIIANYNNSSYLERMFQSLINQTLALNRIQILFIDDKSTDNSLEIALEYVENYDSLEIYSLKENTGGAHGPRNIGILNARGNMLFFLMQMIGMIKSLLVI
ncbi:glycosyltransferase family A protein [Lactococcus garvieae]